MHMLRAAHMLRKDLRGFCFSLLFSLAFSLIWPLVVKEISVKTLVGHKLKEERIQRPHMTKNTVHAKIVWKSYLTNSYSLQQTTKTNPK